ncbi:MAG: copper oxidase [Planctomycetes bacterium GWF2_42_9]|nr:MAG: copper oxidase [Planctomycetes bacterium GWF2_42_9]
MNRRAMMKSGVAATAIAAGSVLLNKIDAAMSQEHNHHHDHAKYSDPNTAVPHGYTPVVTLNGSTLPWKFENGVKVFHLVAEPVKKEFAPGLVVNCWGYNGQTPGPTIEVVEGDRVRILVTNKLPETTSVHWHGILLPNGMDGVRGLNQPPIRPGQTFAYEFTLRQHGTQMYHPHADEMVQIGMGMMGLFIIHPKETIVPLPDRDFAIMLHEWFIKAGTATPNPNIMVDFNYFTFNSRISPAIEHLVVKLGQRVRIRIGNLSMDSHPIHLHGYSFKVTGTDGGPITPTAQWPETTVNVPVGSTRDIEFVADAPGDWALHCHKVHHIMSGMAHDIPNMIGVNQKDVEEKVRNLVPGYMAMGTTGMEEMLEMQMTGPKNMVPTTFAGQFGNVDMGGMFTVLKVRENITDYQDPGWYQSPPGTAAYPVNE